MSRVKDERGEIDIIRLLAGAAKTVASARYCWLATTTENSGTNARPMGGLPRDPNDNDWTVRFITDGRSRKASEIRRSGKGAVIFQHDPDEAYVAVIGAAMLREDASEVRRRWKSAYNPYFPSEEDRANAALVEINAERIELWIRGVTPEPFGLHTTSAGISQRGVGPGRCCSRSVGSAAAAHAPFDRQRPTPRPALRAGGRPQALSRRIAQGRDAGVSNRVWSGRFDASLAC